LYGSRSYRIEELSMSDQDYFVLIRRGDATAEVESALRQSGLSAERAGVHRMLFVTRAHQTVVMARDARAPIVALLLERGWTAPGSDA
jgi:hypothetical protein